tara:strand:- start:31 stop:204 length:174 start_codon:yes stop_codon:yes gene_type:complete
MRTSDKYEIRAVKNINIKKKFIKEKEKLRIRVMTKNIGTRCLKLAIEVPKDHGLLTQ